MAQQLQVFQDPSLVANHPTTPLEQLQNRLSVIAPTYKMTPATPYPLTQTSGIAVPSGPNAAWLGSSFGDPYNLPSANGTQIATKDQSQLPVGSLDTFDPSLGYVDPTVSTASRAAAIQDAMAAGMSPAEAVATDMAGIGPAGTQSASTGHAAAPVVAPAQSQFPWVVGGDAQHAINMARQDTAQGGPVGMPTNFASDNFESANDSSSRNGGGMGSTGSRKLNAAPPSSDPGSGTPPADGRQRNRGHHPAPVPSPTPTPLPVPTPTPAAPSGIAVFNRDVSFPPAGYRPGFDNEWQYFKTKLAAGGVVGYADGGPVGSSDQADPRVMMIADAEDALQHMLTDAGQAQDKVAIDRFVQSFGPSALDQLKANVAEGLSMRAGMPGGGAPPPNGSPGIMPGMGAPDPGQGRLLQGPGTGTSDSIPAIVDGTQPAALSTGEFVVPADAVAGAGQGDPAAGAKMLQDLSAHLAEMHKSKKKKAA